MSLRKTKAAVSTCPEAEAAAEELLRKGNAVDAAIAGVFAACAVKSEVLLGPVQILIGGAGAGLRAFDGRVRQPGLGAPRPRGFRDGDEIPPAARIGVPWLAATLSVAAATSGTATFAQILAPAVALAKSTPRAEILARIASHGSRAIEERPLASELLVVAGRANEGLLTPEDLASPRPTVVEAHRFERAVVLPNEAQGNVDDGARETTSVRDDGAVKVRRRPKDASLLRTLVTLPWAERIDDVPATLADSDAGVARFVFAVDRHGTIAAAVWAETTAGIDVPGLGLRAPFFAEPVRRGVTRLRPGDPRPAPAPIALLGMPAAPEWAVGAFGAPDAYDVLGALVGSHFRDEPLEATGASSWLAVGHVDGAAVVHR